MINNEEKPITISDKKFDLAEIQDMVNSIDNFQVDQKDNGDFLIRKQGDIINPMTIVSKFGEVVICLTTEQEIVWSTIDKITRIAAKKLQLSHLDSFIYQDVEGIIFEENILGVLYELND